MAQACLPAGQMKPFRKNCMALMTGTGAKGSQVNFSQISCLLGQQVRAVPSNPDDRRLRRHACFSPAGK